LESDSNHAIDLTQHFWDVLDHVSGKVEAKVLELLLSPIGIVPVIPLFCKKIVTFSLLNFEFTMKLLSSEPL
jgi:hypothetical protein